MPSLVENQLWPLFGFTPSHEERDNFLNNLSHFWSQDSEEFAKRKLADTLQYEQDIKTLYDTEELLDLPSKTTE